MLLDTIHFEQRQSLCVRPKRLAELDQAVQTLGLERPRPVIVLIGGAGGIQEQHQSTIQAAIQIVCQAAERYQAAVLDGGTRAGVMATMGQARASSSSHFPLIGVAAEGTVTWPGRYPPLLAWLRNRNRAALEPHHTHFILVPGDSWGTESPWLAKAATQLSQGAPSITVLINGGQISRQADLPNSLKAKRPVLAVAGTGRAADQLAEQGSTEPGVRVISQQELAGVLQEILDT